jgi:ligand-binding sensor domain-containing protein/serine phosphatase RsbU (regulator of sigma subunit)
MKNLFLLLYFFVFSFIGLSQTFNFDNYSVEDGLSQNQVLSIYQDHKGYIWIGTNGGGISCFDGKKFTTINEQNGLASNIVYGVKQDDKGVYYIATTNGITVLKNGVYRNFNDAKGLKNNMVFDLLPKGEEVWLATAGGMCIFKNDSIYPFTQDSLLASIPIFRLYEDNKNQVWCGSITKGAFKLSNGQLTNYNKESGLLHNFVRAFVEDEHENMWIGSAAGFNYLNNKNGKIEERKVHENETQTTITSVVKDKDNVLWFGTEAGLVRYQNNIFKRFTTENGLVSNSVFTVCSDKEGNIWAGTNGKGISKFNYKGDVFYNYSTKNGLSNDIVNAIFQDSKGTYWFGSQDGGITKYDADGFYTFKDNLPGNVQLGIATKAFDIVEDKDGRIWIATQIATQGVHIYDGKKFTVFSKEDGLTDNNVVSFLAEKDGSILIGTYNGITKYSEGIFTPFLNNEVKGKIWSMVKTKKNHYWFASEKGALYYDGNRVQYFGEKDGFIDERVRTVVEDADGMIWFATAKGLFRFDGVKFDKFTNENGLTATNIYSLIIDRKGMLWAGTQFGIQRINTSQYNKSAIWETKIFAKQEGFIGLECNNNAAFEDSKGQLWFGTVKGVTVFNPDKETINLNEPLTYISKIRLDFEKFDFTKYCDSIDTYSSLPINLVLPYNKNHLTFDFIGISLTAPQKVRYQYMLEPLDKGWFSVTEKQEAVYSHIPPGTYTFKLKAMNNDGVWNENPITFQFTILPPWYLTWWAIISYIIIVIFGFYSYTIYRTKALTKQKQILEEQVAQRTSELRKEKEKVEEINKQVLHQNEVIEEKNKEITDSINYAKGIQEAILPNPEKVKAFLPESFILFRPKDIVSGDFYWMDEKDGKVFFTAADCTGHGVPGAFVSMVGANGLNRSLNGYALRKPSDILDKLTELVEETFKKRKDGMDLGLCAYEPSKNILEYAGANNPLWVMRKKGSPLKVNDIYIEPCETESELYDLYEVKANKQPVGSFEARVPFENNNIEVIKGDMFYIFSDGYPDQFGGPKGKKFKSKTLKLLLLSIADKSMEEQKEILNQSIEDWMAEGNIEQIDDICVFGVKAI